MSLIEENEKEPMMGENIVPFVEKLAQEETELGDEIKREVVIHVTFIKIGEINTLKEQFDADVLVMSRWREQQLDEHDLTSKVPINWEKYWDPKLYIDNYVTEPKRTILRDVEKDLNGRAYVKETRRIKGSFMETLELVEFPFDVQDLSINIMSDVPANEIDIIEDSEEIHKIYKQSFIDEQEWYLYKYVESEKTYRLKDLADPTLKRVSLTVRCRAARRPAYFVWNIISVTLLITFLSFTTFAVPHHLTQNRLQLTYTLILTSVAFKFVVHQSLPRISYLTYLDRYILAAMVMLTLTCVWHGLQTKIDAADERDYIALIVLISIYALYNIQFFLRILLVPYRKRREMARREKEYTQKVKTQALKRASTRNVEDAPKNSKVKRQAVKKRHGHGDRESQIPLASLEDV